VGASCDALPRLPRASRTGRAGTSECMGSVGSACPSAHPACTCTSRTRTGFRPAKTQARRPPPGAAKPERGEASVTIARAAAQSQPVAQGPARPSRAGAVRRRGGGEHIEEFWLDQPGDAFLQAAHLGPAAERVDHYGHLAQHSHSKLPTSSRTHRTCTRVGDAAGCARSSMR
jgi:hypothetical protein